MTSDSNNMITGPVKMQSPLNLSDKKVHLNTEDKNISSERAEQSLEIESKDKMSKSSPSLKEIADVTVAVNKFFNVTQRNLEFSVDDSTDEVVMSLVDKTTGEVIRQFPSEEALDMLQRLQELQSNTGVFVQEKA